MTDLSVHFKCTFHYQTIDWLVARPQRIKKEENWGKHANNRNEAYPKRGKYNIDAGGECVCVSYVCVCVSDLISTLSVIHGTGVLVHALPIWQTLSRMSDICLDAYICFYKRFVAGCMFHKSTGITREFLQIES